MPRATRSFGSVFLALALAGGIASGLRAQDWTEFRGPTGQGISVSTNLPLTWNATNNVAWKQTLPGLGWSSPALSHGRIYLTSALKPESGGLSLHALCLDARDGRIQWDKEIFQPSSPGSIHQKNSHSSPTPLIVGDRVYVHFGHYGTACLDLEGKVVWRNNDLHYSPVHGNGGSPIMVGDLLVFSCDGGSDPFIVALDRKDGQIRWKTPRMTDAHKKFSFSTPLLIEQKGQRQIISPGSGAVCAFDPVSGRELWRARYGEGYSVIPRPVFGHGLLFVSSGYDTPTAFAIRADGIGDVTDSHVAWTLKRGAPHTPSMLLVGDELYMVSDGGIASCVDARTGHAHWQERVGGNFSASPVLAAGRIYLLSEEGITTVLKPGKTFEILASNPLGERALASMAIGRDSLFIRTDQHLFCLRQTPDRPDTASR